MRTGSGLAGRQLVPGGAGADGAGAGGDLVRVGIGDGLAGGGAGT